MNLAYSFRSYLCHILICSLVIIFKSLFFSLSFFSLSFPSLLLLLAVPCSGPSSVNVLPVAGMTRQLNFHEFRILAQNSTANLRGQDTPLCPALRSARLALSSWTLLEKVHFQAFPIGHRRLRILRRGLNPNSLIQTALIFFRLEINFFTS